MIKTSLNRLIENPSFVGKIILYYTLASFGFCLCFIGQFFTFPLVNIYVYNQVVNFVKSESIDTVTGQKPRKGKPDIHEGEHREVPVDQDTHGEDHAGKPVKDIHRRMHEEVQSIRETPGDKSARQSGMGWTSLHEAINMGALDRVKALTNDKTKINTKGGLRNITPLELAVRKENVDILKLLLEAEDIDLNINRERILEKAFDSKNSKTIKILLDHKMGNRIANKKSKWSIIKITNEWKEVIRLGAASETTSSSDRLDFPYHDLKATLMYDGKDTLIRFNSNSGTVLRGGEVQSSGTLYHRLAVRIDNKDYTWGFFELPGTSDIKFEKQTSFILASWSTGREFAISLPLYDGGNANFHWELIGASDTIASTF